jgi:hypothetical protein
LGAVRTDNYDGSGDVSELNGTVDTAILGDYLITYSYTDGAGNSGTGGRTVKILASTADEDNDGYTNEEEIIEGTDPLDEHSHPTPLPPNSANDTQNG